MVRRSEKGRRRLRMLLSFLFGGATLFTVVLVLIGYKAPYNPIWWLVLGAIVMGAFLAPLLLVPAIEWVMEGYAEDKEREERS
jgi:RsiW-degrading membrane proteinase PrsW (M82 family)